MPDKTIWRSPDMRTWYCTGDWRPEGFDPDTWDRIDIETRVPLTSFKLHPTKTWAELATDHHDWMERFYRDIAQATIPQQVFDAVDYLAEHQVGEAMPTDIDGYVYDEPDQPEPGQDVTIAWPGGGEATLRFPHATLRAGGSIAIGEYGVPTQPRQELEGEVVASAGWCAPSSTYYDLDMYNPWKNSTTTNATPKTLREQISDILRTDDRYSGNADDYAGVAVAAIDAAYEFLTDEDDDQDGPEEDPGDAIMPNLGIVRDVPVYRGWRVNADNVDEAQAWPQPEEDH